MARRATSAYRHAAKELASAQRALRAHRDNPHDGPTAFLAACTLLKLQREQARLNALVASTDVLDAELPEPRNPAEQHFVNGLLLHRAQRGRAA